MTTSISSSQKVLNNKILEYFPGLVVRKDLTAELKQNAVVPTYVLEYLLGQHCATDDPQQIQEGLETVRRILSKHYVHRNQSELIKSTIKDRGNHKVIEKWLSDECKPCLIEHVIEGYDEIYSILTELDDRLLWHGWPLIGRLHDPIK